MFSRIGFCSVIGAIFIASAAMAPSASAATDDACALLTQAQVSAALGVSMNAGTHVTPTYLKTCTWTPAASSPEIASLTVSFQAADAYGAAKNLMGQSAARITAEGKDGSQLADTSPTGIGDDAYYTSMGTGYTALMVKKGDVAFKVALYGKLPLQKKKAMVKALAQQVVSKL
jgi:hypothetical protein